jgi:hypothetical protein
MDSHLWLWLGGATGAFCVVRGIADLRARRYVWGAIGMLVGLAWLLTPIQTQSVKLDLPAAAGR